VQRVFFGSEWMQILPYANFPNPTQALVVETLKIITRKLISGHAAVVRVAPEE